MGRFAAALAFGSVAGAIVTLSLIVHGVAEVEAYALGTSLGLWIVYVFGGQS